MRSTAVPVFIAVVGGMLACSEPFADRATTPHLQSITQSGTCPAHATKVVASEGDLMAALEGASPGDTIAIRGTIALDQPEFDVVTSNVTVTCATPGSGVVVATGNTPSWLFVVWAPGVTIEHLALDARGAAGGSYLAIFDGVGGFASDERFTHNQITCGPMSDSCVFFALEGSHGATATDNAITTAGTGLGLHLEGVVGGSIARNSVVATDSGSRGILVDAGSGVDVADDSVRGPWNVAVLVKDAADSITVERGNFSGGSFATIRLVDLTHFRFLGNTVTCSAICFEMFGSPGAHVTGNRVVATGAITGIDVEPHNELVTDGATVDGNVIQALSPSGIAGEGGIHVSTGTGLTVTNNTVTGPWVNSMALTFLAGSRIQGNTLVGSAGAGIAFTTDTATQPITFTGDTVQSNVVTAWSTTGVSIQAACRNLLAGNVVEGKGTVDLLLAPTTGANRVVAGARGIVNQGAQDCDGDGIVDPNVIGR